MRGKAPENELSGLFLADKEPGITSHDLVLKVRALASQKAVGHAGTLDPMATGLMCVLLGKATKIAPYLVKLDKTYVATARLGLSTDTCDATGKILETHPGPFPGPGEVEKALKSFLGPVEQVPPAFSAVKVDGKRAYLAARAGEPLTLSPRTVET